VTARILDHLVVAARALDEGAAYICARLGVDCVAGGRHATMGTHNRLLSLGPSAYLEVIAIDPEAPAPARPRWFELDATAMKTRLARGPALVHWVERTDDLERDAATYPGSLSIVPFERGPYRWRMALAPDGSFPARGTLPTLIQWDGPHPCAALPDSGIRLRGLRHENGALRADFAVPGGLRTIP
jgi:hypothetical protein